VAINGTAINCLALKRLGIIKQTINLCGVYGSSARWFFTGKFWGFVFGTKLNGSAIKFCT